MGLLILLSRTDGAIVPTCVFKQESICNLFHVSPNSCKTKPFIVAPCVSVGKKIPVPNLAENEKQKELKGKGGKSLLVYFTKINPGLTIKSKTYYLCKGLVINLYKDGTQNGIIFYLIQIWSFFHIFDQHRG